MLDKLKHLTKTKSFHICMILVIIAIILFVVGMLFGGLLEDQLTTLSIWAAIPIVLVLLAGLTIMNWLLRRKNKYIKI